MRTRTAAITSSPSISTARRLPLLGAGVEAGIGLEVTRSLIASVTIRPLANCFTTASHAFSPGKMRTPWTRPSLSALRSARSEGAICLGPMHRHPSEAAATISLPLQMRLKRQTADRNKFAVNRSFSPKGTASFGHLSDPIQNLKLDPLFFNLVRLPLRL